MKRIFTLLAALTLGLAFASTASAQSSINGYNNEAGQVQSQVDSGSDEPVDEVQPVAAVVDSDGGDGGGSLPFTGLDVVLLLVAGGMLLVVGVGMRRLTRSA